MVLYYYGLTTKTKMVEFLVEESGDCKKVYIPREYCTIFIQNAVKDKENIMTGIVGDDIKIQNLANDLPCQNRRRTK